MALCKLARQALPNHQIKAFIVDHNLAHMNVSENPLQVKDSLSNLGMTFHANPLYYFILFYCLFSDIQHEVLKLDWSEFIIDEIGKGKLQEWSRELRYEALFNACFKNRIPLLLTAHNLDDDVATMFYRMGHLSGLDGIAGMKQLCPFPVKSSYASQYFIGRPLLSMSKDRLLATCHDWKLNYTLDKCNNDLDFGRNIIKKCLDDMAASDPELKIDGSLGEMLEFFKQIRRDLHNELVMTFDKSVILNKISGDSTLILNAENWLRNRPLALRLFTTLMQYSSAHKYPPRTQGLIELYQNLQRSYEEYDKKHKLWIGKLQRMYKEVDLMPVDKTKRVNVAQHCSGGSIFKPLCREDAMRRITLQKKLEGRDLEYGPAFLIQRTPPPRISTHEAGLGAVDVRLSSKKMYLWDNRVYMSYECPLDNSSSNNTKKKERLFQISFMTKGDIDEFTDMTKNCDGSLRKRIYSYMSMTPASHFYQIPVIRLIEEDLDDKNEEINNLLDAENDDNVTNSLQQRQRHSPSYPASYMAFPTLRTDFPVGKFKWNLIYAGNVQLVSKFICLP